MLNKCLVISILLVVGILLMAPMVRAVETSAPSQRVAASPVLGRPTLPLAGDWKVQYVQEPGAAPGETWEAKPVVMPKIIRMPGLLNTNNPGLYKYGTWLERSAEIPVNWQGRRVVLKVGRCLYGVGVYVDGRKAGEIPGYGGDVDVTALVTPDNYRNHLESCLKNIGKIRDFLETDDEIFSGKGLKLDKIVLDKIYRSNFLKSITH